MRKPDTPLLTHLKRHHPHHFAALLISPTDDFPTIKAAHKSCILRFHPDKSHSTCTTASFLAAKEAFRVLKTVILGAGDTGFAAFGAGDGAWRAYDYNNSHCAYADGDGDEEELQEYSRPKTKPGSYAWTAAQDTPVASYYDEPVNARVFSHTFKTGAFHRKTARAMGEGEGYVPYCFSGSAKGKGKEKKEGEKGGEEGERGKQAAAATQPSWHEDAGFSFVFEESHLGGTSLGKNKDDGADNAGDDEDVLFDSADEAELECFCKRVGHDKRASAW